MLCYGMLWYVMVRYVMVCYGILWYVMAWYGMLWYVMVCYGMLCYGMLWYVMVCYVMVCMCIYIIYNISVCVENCWIFVFSNVMLPCLITRLNITYTALDLQFARSIIFTYIVTHVKGCMISSPNLSFVPLWQEPCGLPASDFRSHLWFFSAYPSAPKPSQWPQRCGHPLPV